MLAFIRMVNNTFVETTLYGLTSLYSLVIQETDNWQDKWYIKVSSSGDTFFFEYEMPGEQSPWKGATVRGEAKSVEEARDFLIIAMTNCEGWADNRELKKLYDQLKGRETGNQKFTLWLEFEEVDPNNWDIENEFCNIHVTMEDGRQYGINIWTYRFLETAIDEDRKSGKNLDGLYQTPPDLFVKELTRTCIEQTIQDLLKIDDLEKVLNPGIIVKPGI